MLDAPERISPLHRSSVSYFLRYEDIAQDGRLILEGSLASLGPAVWAPLIAKDAHVMAAMRAKVLPLFTRLSVVGEGGPFGVENPVGARGAYELAHAVDAAGAVDRLLLNMWVDLAAPTRSSARPSTSPPTRAARIYAEHVFTRPFAPPDQRKVRAFDLPGVEPVPKVRVELTPPETFSRVPDGAEAIDAAPHVEEATTVLGLRHTDGNQHVNSLVYLRVFEESALRRFHALGESAAVLARSLDIAYRKPLFAGQRARVALRAYRLEGKLGAAGVVYSDDASIERPNAYVRLLFER